MLAQSQDCANVLHNFKIGKQFPDSENVQRNLENVQRNLENVQLNLEIAQIPRLLETHIHPTHTDGVCVCRI